MDTKRGEITDFSSKDTTDKVSVRFLDTARTTELQSDFTLPDYDPEIKKLLRTDIMLTPISHYIGAGNVELSGRVTYTLLYSTSNGKIASAELSDDFSFDCNLELPISVNEQDGIDIIAVPQCESIFCRVTAPRKVNIRSKLHTSISGFGKEDISLDIPNAERLTTLKKSIGLRRSVCEDIELEDELTTNGEKPISASGRVLVVDISGDMCRGEAEIKLLFPSGSVLKKLPFTQNITLKEGERLIHVFGEIGEIKLEETVTGDGLMLSLNVTLEAEILREDNAELMVDAFIPGTCSEVTYRTVKTESLAGSGHSVIRLDGIIPQAELNNQSGTGISLIDTDLKAHRVNATVEEGHCMLSGDLSLRILTNVGDEYTHSESNIPFELDTEISMPSDETPRPITSIQILSLKSDLGTDGLRYNAEIGIDYTVLTSSENMVVKEVTQKQTNTDESNNGMTVFYPEKGADLWDVSKRFAKSPSAIAELNCLTGDLTESVFEKGHIIIL